MGYINKACCCCQLSTSAVLLGWTGAAGYFIALVSFSVSFASIDFSETEELSDIFRIVFTLSAILVSLVNIVGCVCLMVGSIKKIRVLMVPWLIGEIIFMIFLIFVIISCIVEFIKRQRSYLMQPIVIFLLYLIFQFYVWICVYSLFQEYRDQDIKKLGVETKKSTTIKDDPQPYSSFA